MVAFNRCGLVVCLVAMALDCHHAANPSIGQSATDTPHENRQTPRRDSFAHLIGQKRRRYRCHHFHQFGWRAALRAAFWGMGERSVLVGGLPRPVLAVRQLCHAGRSWPLARRLSCGWPALFRLQGGPILTYTDRLQAPEGARFRLLVLPFAVCDRPRSEPPPGAA